MNTIEKIQLIEQYRNILNELRADIAKYLIVNKLKKTDLIVFLREKLNDEKTTNVAFYAKIKNPYRWKYDEILLTLEFINDLEKKKVVISFYDLLKEQVNQDIDKSPFQFKFFMWFYDQYFDFDYSSVYYNPLRWRANLSELIEIYRLIAHVEHFKVSTGIKKNHGIFKE
jgi:hypothetical protein